MDLKFKNVKRFQEGGEVTPAGAPGETGAPTEETGAPAGGGQEEMLAQLQQMAQQIIQQLGPDAAAALAQMIMEMLQGAGAPEAGTPAEEGQPVYRNGGALLRRIKK